MVTLLRMIRPFNYLISISILLLLLAIFCDANTVAPPLSNAPYLNSHHFDFTQNQYQFFSLKNHKQFNLNSMHTRDPGFMN